MNGLMRAAYIAGAPWLYGGGMPGICGAGIRKLIVNTQSSRFVACGSDFLQKLLHPL